MPRYHFHCEDGRRLPDPEGTVLPSDDAAKLEAVRVMAELLREDPHLFWAHECFRLTVTDDTNLTLFVLELNSVTAPAASRGSGTGRGARRARS